MCAPFFALPLILFSPSQVRQRKIEQYREIGGGNNGRARALTASAVAAQESGLPPSEAYKGKTPNKKHQALLRNMGMARTFKPDPQPELRLPNH